MVQHDSFDDEVGQKASPQSCASLISTLQAVIQNPFSNGSSPGGETVAGETRFAYFPAAAVSDGTAVSVQATADPTITQAGGEHRRRRHGMSLVSHATRSKTDPLFLTPGQFYVMMTQPEVLQTTAPRTIAPRTHTFTT